ncbi:MAG TPA: phosphoribosyltransferase family protein [Flavobacterium sp.]|nr:phosphoribosyltransferase family protein [Flavobacterium sp.]
MYDILQDRKEAAMLLSEKLEKYQGKDAIVLAVPRGGVPIGYEIAKNLHLPLDVILSKKIGHPSNKEFAIGAVSLDSSFVDEHPDIPEKYIEGEIKHLRESLQEQYIRYMGDRPPTDVKDKIVILVDDGIATGNTLLACINMLREKNPQKIVVAVPVVPLDTVPVIQKNADEFVYYIASKNFNGVGDFYEDFEQVHDEEVIRLLNAVNLID